MVEVQIGTNKVDAAVIDAFKLAGLFVLIIMGVATYVDEDLPDPG